MKKLTEFINRYIHECTWTDYSFLKTCLFSLGMVVGMMVPEKNKHRLMPVMKAVFLGTYIILLKKAIKIFKEIK